MSDTHVIKLAQLGPFTDQDQQVALVYELVVGDRELDDLWR